MNSQSISHRQGIVLLVTAVLIWSTAGVLIKRSTLTAWQLCGIVNGIGFLVQLLFVRRIPRDLSWNTIKAVLVFSAFSILAFIALKLTTAASVVALQATAPIFSAVFSFYLFGRRMTQAEKIAIPLVFVGVLLFCGDKIEIHHIVGNILALLTGALVALYSIYMEKETRPRLELAMLGSLSVFFLSLPVVVDATLTPQTIVETLIYGVFLSGIGWALYAKAMEVVTATEALLLIAPEIILNPLLVALFVGEKPGILGVCGALVVLSTVTWYGLQKLKES